MNSFDIKRAERKRDFMQYYILTWLTDHNPMPADVRMQVLNANRAFEWIEEISKEEGLDV